MEYPYLQGSHGMKDLVISTLRIYQFCPHNDTPPFAKLEVKFQPLSRRACSRREHALKYQGTNFLNLN